MPKNIKIIPHYLHFIWIGNGIEQYKESLNCWRDYHPNYTIYLWISKQNITPPGFVSFLEKQKIQLKIIETETRFRNYKIILQEINRRNPWSASDILRISILLIYPGFYFDINIKPKKALPDSLQSREGALFCLNVEYSIQYNNIALNYKMLATAEKDQPLFIKVSQLIAKNFQYLAQEKSLVEEFFALSGSEKEKKYFFAVFVTGRAMSFVLRDYYLPKKYLSEKPTLDIDLLILDNLFLESYLNIPLPQGESANQSLYKLFEKKMNCHGIYLSQFKKIENTSLVDRLNAKISYLQFSTLWDEYGFTYARAKVEAASQKREMTLLRESLEKSKIYGGYSTLGKSKFFVLPQLNDSDQAEKVTQFLKNENVSFACTYYK